MSPDAAEVSQQPLVVSIIINNYNYAGYLPDAIRSALAQSYPWTEVVVVDDGSTDGSANVIKSFDNIIACFQENGGQTAAVKTGLAHATGDIVILLDADDTLFENAAERIVSCWKRDVCYVMFRLRIFSKGDADLGVLPPGKFKADPRAFLRKHGRFPHAPTSGNAFNRRLVWEILTVTAAPNHDTVDALLPMCAALSGDHIVSIDECLGGYRVHQSNLSWSVTLERSFFGQAGVERSVRRYAGYKHVDVALLRNLSGPYHYQRAIKLFLKGDKRVSCQRARYSGTRLMWTVVTYPDIGVGKKIKNVLLGLFVAISPRLARWVFRGKVKWEVSPMPIKE